MELHLDACKGCDDGNELAPVSPPNEREETPAKAPSRGRRIRAPAPDKPFVCRAQGCGAPDDKSLTSYARRFRLCPSHIVAKSLRIVGEDLEQRFCQKFDGAAKSCRASLRRNRAQRKSRAEASRAAACLTADATTADDVPGGACIAAGMKPLADG